MDVLLAAGDGERVSDLELGTARLRRQLRTFVEIRPSLRGKAPDGTRAGVVETVGAIALVVAPVAVTIKEMLKLILAWTGQRPGRSVRIGDIVLEGLTPVQVDRFIDAVIASHLNGPSDG